MSKKHHGTSLDSFVEEEGAFEESQVLAIREVLAWQLTEAMEKQAMSKSRLATPLKISRSQVDRLLDPTRDVTPSTLQRAAALVGRKVQIELVRPMRMHPSLVLVALRQSTRSRSPTCTARRRAPASTTWTTTSSSE